MTRILVTGATGRVGREVLARLSKEGVQVRALVRDSRTAGLAPYIEAARADLTIPETLDQCLSEIDTVFLVWTAPAAAVGPALDRIVRRVRRVVFLSSPYKTPHPFFQAAQPNAVSAMQAEIERLIEGSECQWTFLRPGTIAANALGWWAPRIRAGCDVVRWPHIDARPSPIDERDIAAVAVRALCDAGHDGAEYLLTGPESLSQAEQLETIGDAIGRSLYMEEISPHEARRELLAVISDAEIADMLLKAWAAATRLPALVTNTVQEITEVPPRSFRKWAADTRRISVSWYLSLFRLPKKLRLTRLLKTKKTLCRMGVGECDQIL